MLSLSAHIVHWALRSFYGRPINFTPDSSHITHSAQQNRIVWLINFLERFYKFMSDQKTQKHTHYVLDVCICENKKTRWKRKSILMIISHMNSINDWLSMKDVQLNAYLCMLLRFIILITVIVLQLNVCVCILPGEFYFHETNQLQWQRHWHRIS